ncbi:heterokaryon incompatibility protein-domain-containing protein [Hypomontagnella submonticulosa]|nr:heterokaryon incompatibility protein-domain-containing protein [Hypomontagnella submonticulosa]
MLCQNCHDTIKALVKQFKICNRDGRNCQNTIKALAERFKIFNRDGRNDSFPSRLHYSRYSFHKSVLEGCLICRQIWTHLLGNQDAPVPETLQEFCLKIQDYESSVGGSRYDEDPIIEMSMDNNNGYLSIVASPTEVWPRGGMRFSLSPIPRSGSNIVPTLSDPILKARHSSTGGMAHLWRHWYNVCSKTHASCQARQGRLQSFTPTRLIELLDYDRGDIYEWRLVCPHDGSSIQYLTLSHCWGSSKHTCLTERSYQEFLGGSPIATLPQTYRDACIATSSLGFRYIWIDSLCIIQDSIEDWRTQSSLMHLIYKSASCNIAATWAEGGNDGCFRTVDPCLRDPTSITLDFEVDGHSEYLISKSDTHHEDIAKAPLNQRGWVIQERYLARRQLGFSKRQAYWECPELIASEQLPTGIPETLWNPMEYGIYHAKLPPKKPHLDAEEEMDIRKCWRSLVERYSACYLTYESDRLIALAGLIGELEQNMKDVCLAGLWRRDLHRQLCWHYDMRDLYKVYRSTTQGRIAPTWSWANLDGPVTYDTIYCEEVDDVVPYVKFIGPLEDSNDQDRLRNLGVLKLSLQGIALWGRPVKKVGKIRSHFIVYDHNVSFHNESGTLITSELDNTGVLVSWDETMPPAPENATRRPSAERERVQRERSSNLLFLMVRSSRRYHWRIQGLILRKLPSPNEGTYIRMGLFLADPAISRLLSARLGLQSTNPVDIKCDIDFDDSRIADLVHTVSIV